jgi:hypothetical protein
VLLPPAHQRVCAPQIFVFFPDAAKVGVKDIKVRAVKAAAG